MGDTELWDEEEIRRLFGGRKTVRIIEDPKTGRIIGVQFSPPVFIGRRVTVQLDREKFASFSRTAIAAVRRMQGTPEGA